jgi:hypothetical protein
MFLIEVFYLNNYKFDLKLLNIDLRQEFIQLVSNIFPDLLLKNTKEGYFLFFSTKENINNFFIINNYIQIDIKNHKELSKLKTHQLLNILLMFMLKKSAGNLEKQQSFFISLYNNIIKSSLVQQNSLQEKCKFLLAFLNLQNFNNFDSIMQDSESFTIKENDIVSFKPVIIEKYLLFIQVHSSCLNIYNFNNLKHLNINLTEKQISLLQLQQKQKRIRKEYISIGFIIEQSQPKEILNKLIDLGLFINIKDIIPGVASQYSYNIHYSLWKESMGGTYLRLDSLDSMNKKDFILLGKLN